MSHNIEPVLAAVRHVLASHRLVDDQGRPCGFMRLHPAEAKKYETGYNAYGCADGINILYTLGDMPAVEQWPVWQATLQDLQSPDDGLFHEGSHHPFHTTAHCIAALELLGARALHPVHAMAELRQIDAMQEFLSQLDWANNPWRA